MKKNYALASVLALTVAMMVGGMSSCSNNQDGKVSTITFSRQDSLRLPVAYVNVDSLLMNYDFAKELNEELVKKTEDARVSFNTQAQQLEREVNEFQRKVQTNAFVSQQSAENQAKTLQQKKDRLDQLNINLQQQLANDQAQMNARLSDSIRNFLLSYNETAGFELIFTNTMYDNIIIDFPKYDITADVLDKLNARYNSTKE